MGVAPGQPLVPPPTPPLTLHFPPHPPKGLRVPSSAQTEASSRILLPRGSLRADLHAGRHWDSECLLPPQGAGHSEAMPH